MLEELTIENAAVIEHADVEFTGGLNVMTGETGAGKSILIDSINAILGSRTSREIVRTGSDRAVIQAVFSGISGGVRDKLREAGYDSEDDQLILQREIGADGRTRCRINGMPAPAGAVRSICSSLVTIHGQHDSTDLLDPSTHISILDRYGDLGSLRDSYTEAYREMLDLRRRLSEVTIDDAERERRTDLLTYEIDEIEKAGLRPGEDEELTRQRNILRNSEKLIEAMHGALEALNGPEDGEGGQGAVDLLSEASSQLDSVSSVSDDMGELSGKVSDLYYQAQDTASEIQDALDGLDTDGGDLQSVEDRLDLIYRLKKKYGSTIDEILEFLEKCRTELSQIEDSTGEAARLEAKLKEAEKRTMELGKELSDARREAFSRLSERIVGELAFLNMPGSVFSLRMEEKEPGPDGIDEVEFLLSTNPGEDPKPLSRIASGGELSRIMLAIKNVLAEKDSIDTLIFDEIDSGVSGSGAQKIGLKLKQTSGTHQIICVTHTAQIAAFADTHLLVSKEVRGGKTYTDVEKLGMEGHIREIARIVSGENITDTALRNASEMISLAKKAYSELGS
ncbi:MAG: DNA repair protein RecN [Oscillospiraceae bacterium]|jgi:DNA repair protein RecN (Recombination protein N)